MRYPLFLKPPFWVFWLIGFYFFIQVPNFFLDCFFKFSIHREALIFSQVTLSGFRLSGILSFFSRHNISWLRRSSHVVVTPLHPWLWVLRLRQRRPFSRCMSLRSLGSIFREGLYGWVRFSWALSHLLRIDEEELSCQTLSLASIDITVCDISQPCASLLWGLIDRIVFVPIMPLPI